MKTILLFFVCVCLAFSQGITGTIHGIVSDASGARIAGVKVTAINLGTNVARTTATAADGSYTLLYLPVGTYRVEASQSGFKKFDQTGIVLEVNRDARVDAVLEVGGVNETVEVKADAVLVEGTRPALGQTVNNADIENLPLVDRDVYSLLTLTAGVDTTGQASDNFGSPMQVTLINGSANSGIGSVNYTLDGGTNSSGLRNTGNSLPNPDAVREFRVITNGYSAEYGRFAGGVVEAVSNSGTNQIHGSLFEFLRNTKLNANRWLPGQSILRKDPLHRNQFGGSVGGPIKRDRTFAFFSYGGLRQRTTTFANTATPFTPEERTGDLSATGSTAPRDPLNNMVAFPGRILPPSRLDPVAKKITDTYITLPNLAAPGASKLTLFEAQVPHPKDTNEILLKLDHMLSSKHQLSGSYFRVTGEDLVGLLGNMPWVSRDFVWAQNNFNASDTWILSPTKINQFRVQYLRNFGGRVNLPAVALGDLGSTYNIQGAHSLPQISVSGRISLTSAIPGPVAGSNLYQIRDTLNINKGKHSISLGGEMILEKMIHDTLLNNYGVFNFTTTNALGTGNATADYLLGLPANFNQDAPTTKIDNSWYFGFFFQDDIRIAPRLTVNLGVRYDLQPPITDPHDRFLTYVPGAQSKIVTIAPVGLQFPGDPGIGRGIIRADKNNLTPRIGIAWDPFGDSKTAIRAGFGVFSGSMSGNEWNASSDNQPFAIRQTFNNVQSLSNPYGLLPGGVSPFPYNYFPSNPRFLPPSSVVGPSLDYRSPYSYQMNFSVQRQVGRTMNFTVAYSSTLAHRLPISPDQNYPVLSPTATANNVDTRRPYRPANTLGSIGIIKSIMNSSYHGLQMTGDKRFSHGFSMKGFYTFGKGLDVANSQSSTQQVPQDWNNIGADRGRTNNDRTHNFVVSGIWQPDYFRHSPALVRVLASGWSISAIDTMRSGTPLNITSGVDHNFDGNGNDRADLVGDPFLDPNRPRSAVVDKWFNTAAFAQPKNLADGNAGRNILSGPGLKNVDLGIFREFRISESKRLQFRSEMSNAFNLVNLSNPGTSLNSGSNFAKVTTAGQMRQVQLGLRLKF